MSVETGMQVYKDHIRIPGCEILKYPCCSPSSNPLQLAAIVMILNCVRLLAYFETSFFSQLSVHGIDYPEVAKFVQVKNSCKLLVVNSC